MIFNVEISFHNSNSNTTIDNYGRDKPMYVTIVVLFAKISNSGWSKPIIICCQFYLLIIIGYCQAMIVIYHIIYIFDDIIFYILHITSYIS